MHHTRLVCAFSLIRAPRCTVVAQVMHSGGSAGFSNASTCTFFSFSFAHKHAFSLSLSLSHKQPHLAAWMLFLSLSVYFLSRLLSLSLFFLLGRSLSLFLSRVMDSYAAQHEYAVSRSIHSYCCMVSHWSYASLELERRYDCLNTKLQRKPPTLKQVRFE